MCRLGLAAGFVLSELTDQTWSICGSAYPCVPAIEIYLPQGLCGSPCSLVKALRKPRI